MNKIDDETAARIQEFTTWANDKGYHVIGALIGGGKVDRQIQVFCNAPAGDYRMAQEHTRKLAYILYNSVNSGSSELHKELPLGKN
jgi:hypothetical protein